MTPEIALANPSPPRPYGTHSHMHTGALVITLHLVCERFLSPPGLAAEQMPRQVVACTCVSHEMRVVEIRCGRLQ